MRMKKYPTIIGVCTIASILVYLLSFLLNIKAIEILPETKCIELILSVVLYFISYVLIGITLINSNKKGKTLPVIVQICVIVQNIISTRYLGNAIYVLVGIQSLILVLTIIRKNTMLTYILCGSYFSIAAFLYAIVTNKIGSQLPFMFTLFDNSVVKSCIYILLATNLAERLDKNEVRKGSGIIMLASSGIALLYILYVLLTLSPQSFELVKIAFFTGWDIVAYAVLLLYCGITYLGKGKTNNIIIGLIILAIEAGLIFSAPHVGVIPIIIEVLVAAITIAGLVSRNANLFGALLVLLAVSLTALRSFGIGDTHVLANHYLWVVIALAGMVNIKTSSK